MSSKVIRERRKTMYNLFIILFLLKTFLVKPTFGSTLTHTEENFRASSGEEKTSAKTLINNGEVKLNKNGQYEKARTITRLESGDNPVSRAGVNGPLRRPISALKILVCGRVFTQYYIEGFSFGAASSSENSRWLDVKLQSSVPKVPNTSMAEITSFTPTSRCTNFTKIPTITRYCKTIRRRLSRTSLFDCSSCKCCQTEKTPGGNSSLPCYTCTMQEKKRKITTQKL